MDDQDPVVQEIPVYLSQALADNLTILQYPLRPAYMPYDGSIIKEIRIKPNHGDVEFDVAIETKGPHYSRSRGEQYARMTENDGTAYFKSGLMDQQTLSSNHSKMLDPQYIAGALKDGELHLTPLKSIVQLRPTLRHIEIGDTIAANKPSGAQSDGDTTATESEEEEAKPVTVRFARGGIKQKQYQTEPDEQWQTAVYNSILSAEATEGRQLLFGTVEDHTHIFTCTPQEYLNQACPVETNQQNDSPGQSGPSDVLSLTKLKTLPLERQVTEFMKKAMVLPFDRVCTILGRAKLESKERVLDDLQRCAVLVQGCWVVHSSLVLSKELRNARDYVLWCFTKSPVLTRKDLTSVLKITSPQLRELLQPIAVFRTDGSGWHFKQITDNDFMARFPLIKESQKIWWEKRHKEIVLALGIGVSPESSANNPQSHASSGGVAVSGQQLVSVATQKAKDKATPSRPHPLPPGQIIKSEILEMNMALLKNLTPSVVESLKKLFLKIIGKSVATFEQIKSELVSHVTTLPENDELRQQVTVTDSLILTVLSLLGVVNIGEPYNKRVYAIMNFGGTTDKYREVVLEMFKTSRGLKRKLITDEINKRHQQCDNKALTAVLKELCFCKGGGVWVIKGLD